MIGALTRKNPSLAQDVKEGWIGSGDMEGFKYKWMISNELLVRAERRGKYLVFKINTKIISGKLPEDEFWVVNVVKGGFLIRPSKKVLR
jgi:hypothetical protein